MRSWELILADGRRVRLVRVKAGDLLVLSARAGDTAARQVAGRGELRLPGEAGTPGELALRLAPEYAGSGLDYRMGELLLLAGREAGLARVVARPVPEDEAAIMLYRRLGADRARYQQGRFVHEIPVAPRPSAGRSGTWMLDGLPVRT